jgi:hypothetical protein
MCVALGGAVAAPSAMAQAPANWQDFDFGVPIQTPFVCEYPYGLEAAADPNPNCQAAERVTTYRYRNTMGMWQPFDPAAPRPTDIAEATVNGVVVPMIAKTIVGKTPNGSSFAISILQDPAKGENDLSGWNGKLFIGYGGGVQANYRTGTGCGWNANRAFMGDNSGMGINDVPAERGYATACGSLMVMGTNNDDVKSAETTAQIKSIFVELYGEPQFTLGAGASGGSMQQHLIANNYPGLLDAIIPSRSYPDGLTFLQPLYDCELLVNYYENSDLFWTDQARTAVDGYATSRWCAQDSGERYPNDEPTNCAGVVEDALANTPALATAGVRCTYADNMRYVYGLAEIEGALDALGNPAPMAAPLPWDNVGLQYGLQAFNEGKISFAQFIDLNQNIGGIDINGNIMEQRTAADPAVVQIAYETGRIVSGIPLGDIPILDIRRWRDLPLATDNPNNLDVHDYVHSRAIEARLVEVHGDHDNHVKIVTSDGPQTSASAQGVAMARGIAQLDQWLTAIQAAEEADGNLYPTRHALVVATRPADFVDACYLTIPAPAPQNVYAQKIDSQQLCDQLFPYNSHPRLVAGGPVTEDVIKCTLKAVDPSDYSMQLSDAQLDQIRQVFPDGVCDWSQDGVGQVPQLGTWISYDGQGGWTVGQPF